MSHEIFSAFAFPKSQAADKKISLFEKDIEIVQLSDLFLRTPC